ncbi:MAG: TraB/GumN family protein [Chitinophagaceae bacterium]
MKKILALTILLFTVLAAEAQPAKKKYPSLLWEITGNGLKTPSYLFGTMHVSSKMAFHLSDSFYNSIRSVDVVALELDPLRWQDQLFVLQEKQKKLRSFSSQVQGSYITEKSFQLKRFEDELKKALGEEPMVLNSLLYRTYKQRSDFEEDTYLDLYIFQTARKMGKRSTGVEDFFQTEKLITEAYMDMATEKKKKTVNQDEPAYDLEKKAQEAYRKGDLDELDSLEKKLQRSDAFMEKFMFLRNEIQANSIDTILRKQSLFVGVGAAHLPGERGVIELLRRKGYALRPVFMQDRDAKQKEAIDQLHVPVKFDVFREEQGLFSLETPGGKMYRKEEVGETGNTGWQCADMQNGSYYSATRIATQASLIGISEETVLKKLDSMLYESIPGKIISSTPFQEHGYSGRLIVNRTRRGDLQQYKIFITPFDVWVFKISGSGDYAGGAEGKHFLASVKLPERAGHGWKNIAPEHGGFSVSMPLFSTMTDHSRADAEGMLVVTGAEKSSGNAYALLKRTVRQFSFLEEDSFYIGLVEESFKRGELIEKTISRKQVSYHGTPCITAQYKLKEDGYIRARFLTHGNDIYVLLARSRNRETAHETFFSSFSIVPYRYKNFRDYRDTLLGIQVKIPAIPDVDPELRALLHKATSEAYLNSIPDYFQYQEKRRFAHFDNKGTGESVFVSITEFPRYYYAKDTAVFWKKELREEEIREDLLLHSKKMVARPNGASGYEMILRDTNTRKQIWLMVLLQQNRLYRVLYASDSSMVSPFAQTFYSSFLPLVNTGEKAVTEPKSSVFFSDYHSADSATRKRAMEAIPYVYFGAEDVDSITTNISRLRLGEKDYLANKAKFIRELGYIRDSAVVGKVSDALEKLFLASGDTTAIQNAVLEALASNRTKASYTLLNRLLKESPPVYEGRYEYNNFFEKLYDSLQLSATLFPDMMDLSAVEDYKPYIQDLLTTLCDSSLVDASMYKRYFPQLYVDARMELKKMQVGDEKRMDREEEDGLQSNEQEDITGAPVYAYARLLAPFYTQQNNVQLYFKRLLEVRDERTKLAIATLMLEQKLPLPDTMYRHLAAQVVTSAAWLRALEKQDMASKFPASFKKQVDISRSLLLESEGYAQFHAVEMKGRSWVSVKGRSGWVYFFRYKILPDDEWQMGLSGIQPANEKTVDATGDLVRLTKKTIKPGTPMEEQFQDQLIRLIYENRVSSMGFFNEYDRY